MPILTYHHVGPRVEPRGHRRLWVSRERFREQMAYLVRAGYRGLTLRDAAPYLVQGKRFLSKAVVLTFDDGYDNFHRVAYPILREFGFKATVFIVPQQVGTRSQWDPGAETQLMDWPEIGELHQEGVEFGSHTMSHARLTVVHPDTALRELADSKAILERKLGSAVQSLAYPYGDWSPAIEKLAGQAGYGLACSIVRGNLHCSRDLLHLKRVPMDDFTTLPRLRRRLSPVYDYGCRLLRFSRRMRGIRSRSEPDGKKGF